MAYKDRSFGGEPTEWNLNLGFGDQVIIPLCIDVNNARKSGDMILWFNSMSTLTANIAGHSKVKKEKIEKLKALMSSTRKSIPDSVINEQMLSDFKKHELRKVKENLSQIHEDLIGILYDSGLLFPSYSKKNPYLSGLQIR